MNLSGTSQRFLLELSATLGAVECDGQFRVKEVNKIYLIGNGGSAAIASHIANDLVKTNYAPAIALTDASVLTCIANDYGFAQSFTEQLHAHCRMPVAELLICISSSGRSMNILNAATVAREWGMNVATFTGFDPNNRLRGLGHVNYYVPSHNYGIVECAHLAILHSIVNPG